MISNTDRGTSPDDSLPGIRLLRQLTSDRCHRLFLAVDNRQSTPRQRGSAPVPPRLIGVVVPQAAMTIEEARAIVEIYGLQCPAGFVPVTEAMVSPTSGLVVLIVERIRGWSLADRLNDRLNDRVNGSLTVVEAAEILAPLCGLAARNPSAARPRRWRRRTIRLHGCSPQSWSERSAPQRSLPQRSVFDDVTVQVSAAAVRQRANGEIVVCGFWPPATGPSSGKLQADVEGRRQPAVTSRSTAHSSGNPDRLHLVPVLLQVIAAARHGGLRRADARSLTRALRYGGAAGARSVRRWAMRNRGPVGVSFGPPPGAAAVRWGELSADDADGHDPTAWPGGVSRRVAFTAGSGDSRRAPVRLDPVGQTRHGTALDRSSGAAQFGNQPGSAVRSRQRSRHHSRASRQRTHRRSVPGGHILLAVVTAVGLVAVALVLLPPG